MIKEQPMAILVTGGAGYIGSHTVVELLNATKKWWYWIIYAIPPLNL